MLPVLIYCHTHIYMCVCVCVCVCVGGWCIQKSTLIPYDLKRSPPAVPYNVYYNGRYNVLFMLMLIRRIKTYIGKLA